MPIVYDDEPQAGRRIQYDDEPTVGYGEDIGKGAVGGLGRGVAGTLGAGGTIGDLTRWGAEKVLPKKAVDFAAAAMKYGGGPLGALMTGPSGSDVQGAMETVTGKFYEPKTTPGQYASTIAEFAPGALVPGAGQASAVRTGIAKTLNTVVPAITSEMAGQAFKGTAAEPYARLVGGVVGGHVGAKAVTPIAPPSAAYQGAVRTLEAEGIPLTAGQRTGSKGLQYLESNAADMPLVGGQATRLQNRAAEGLDRAVTNRVYDRGELTARGVPNNVNLPDPAVATHGPASLSDNYTRLTQAPFVTNPQFQARMTRAQEEYERLVLPHKRSANIEDINSDIIDRLTVGRGRMAGDEYQSIRSQIGDDIRGATNSKEKAALIEYKRALDEAYMAGLRPADVAALTANNRRYAQMKQIQPAVDTAGEHLSPAKLAQAVRARRGAQYAARQGDLDNLAAAAGVVMKPLPNSGTAARTGAQQLQNVIPNITAGGAGAGIGGLIGGPVGAVVGAAAPFVVPWLATSRVGQAYLGNRALPQNARDLIAQTLAQQIISQRSRENK